MSGDLWRMSTPPVVITFWEWLQILAALAILVLVPMVCGWGGILFDAVCIFAVFFRPAK